VCRAGAICGVDSCNFCGASVDTDYDDEAYQPDPRMSLKAHPDICVCKHCRENEIAEAEQREAMDRS
jgi:hypothetical protein